jgi:Polyketide cyclase / dehydrase and lipid transport
MERSSTQQAHIAAPVELVWELLGDPNRHPEWWPNVVEVECAQLEEGCRYRGVMKGPMGTEEHELLLERLDGCREVSIYCEGAGVFTRFKLAEARGGTFVEGFFGAEPNTIGMKVFAAVAGRRYLRSWLSQSLAGLKQAAERSPAIGRS